MRRLITAFLAVLALAVCVRPVDVEAADSDRATKVKIIKAVAFEDVGGPLYGRYKEQYPQTKPYNQSIIWDKDGCSVPESVTKTVVVYRNLKIELGKLIKDLGSMLRASCDRHDFGYRNYGPHGPGMRLDSAATLRDDIDRRFRDNGDIQCKRRYSATNPLRAVCVTGVTAFYKAVRAGGGLRY